MGNTAAKEMRPRASSYGSGGSAGYDTRPGRRNTTSGVVFGNISDYRKVKKQEEKDRQREAHYNSLVVRFDEHVDGGYLAPYGTYKSNLDFDVEIVRDLIVQRRLAPFYTPLQDFDDSWTDRELYVLAKQLTLHSIEGAYEEEEEDDVDNHKIHKSSNYYKRQEHKAKLKSLLEKTKLQQKNEESRFLEEKTAAKNGKPSSSIMSEDLYLTLYRNPVECPICFLYYPNNLNMSRCCLQPICTECFVQIKRLDPHPPHDDPSANSSSQELPHTLISEPAHCPYCAVTDFGVTFDSKFAIRTGIGGIKPAEFKTIDEAVDDAAISSSPDSNPTPVLPDKSQQYKRKMSFPPDSPKVITIDQIRPDWEHKLSSARNKLARKAAAASAIHASNLIINPSTDSPEYDTRGGRRSSSARYITVEDRMIQEVLKLSLLEEEERQRKERQKKNNQSSDPSSSTDND